MTDMQAFITGLFLDSLRQFSRWYREMVELQVKYATIFSMCLHPEIWDNETTYDDMP